MRDFFRPILLVAWKDALLEIRSKDVVLSALVFAILVIVVFNFALDVTTATVDTVAPGILWVAFTFAGVLAMSRSFVVEREQSSLDGLLLCPISRDSLYFGKMLAIFVFMLVVEAMLLPVFTILFDFSAYSFALVGVILLATLGFAVVGTLFSFIAVHSRSREIMLPVLFLPVVMPVIIGAVESSTAAIGNSGNLVGVGRWAQLLGVFDVVFLVVCPWAFGLVVEE